MFPIKDTIPHRESPFTTWFLLALNTLVFFFELSLPPEALQGLFFKYGLVPLRFTDPQWALGHGLSPYNPLPFLTCMFLHGGWFHFISNMWSLWLFGDNVEDCMGHRRFLAFYLLCGVAAGVIHTAFNPQSPIPTVGASGAIAGVMGAYMVLYPGSRIITLVPVFFFFPIFLEIPAVVFLGLWFLSQLFSGLFSLVVPGGVGGIAWWAHVGGFLFGILLLPLFRRRRRYRGFFADEWFCRNYF